MKNRATWGFYAHRHLSGRSRDEPGAWYYAALDPAEAEDAFGEVLAYTEVRGPFPTMVGCLADTRDRPAIGASSTPYPPVPHGLPLFGSGVEQEARTIHPTPTHNTSTTTRQPTTPHDSTTAEQQDLGLPS